jgi:uncharacterized membrane protein YozB (DUF420 family)
MATRPLSSRVPAILFALALLSTLPILWRVVLPMLSGTNWPEHGGHVPVVLAHAIGGLAMLGLGAAALYIGWTRKAFRRHKWFGYSYLILGGSGAVFALVLSIQAPHPPRSLYIATGTLALVWLAVAAMAWRAARNKRFDSHREWMIRSYVLTWTFVGCRLATMVDFYPWLGAEGTTAAIWVNWIVPLVICEIALRWKEGAPLRPRA